MTGTGTRIKICGLCDADDARAAVDAGAHALGVILAPGYPRSVTLEEAAGILAVAPEGVWRVGVFVDATVDEVARAAERAGITHAQLHGAATPEACAAMPVPTIRVFAVGEGFAAAEVAPFRGAVAAVLLDAHVPGKPGGTGVRIATGALPVMPADPPWFLAGGLTPATVGEAVLAARPWGVDVSSGVERRVREKDHEAMRRFGDAVRAADETMKVRT